ncbi:hypothetical protein HELRODRAFT_70552, partial [Helobdella robusta]|uniref:EGF-like domain-containing protein n=1 Tax=Helobdella robusta TaxID=6412 RepID=T1G082_HELRO
ELNECASNPCLNAATCLNLVNQFKCICTDEFTGTHCQHGNDDDDDDDMMMKMIVAMMVMIVQTMLKVV